MNRFRWASNAHIQSKLRCFVHYATIANCFSSSSIQYGAHHIQFDCLHSICAAPIERTIWNYMTKNKIGAISQLSDSRSLWISWTLMCGGAHSEHTQYSTKRMASIKTLKLETVAAESRSMMRERNIVFMFDGPEPKKQQHSDALSHVNKFHFLYYYYYIIMIIESQDAQPIKSLSNAGILNLICCAIRRV